MSVVIDGGVAAAYVLDEAVQSLCDGVGAHHADIIRAALIEALAAGSMGVKIVGAAQDYAAMNEAVGRILSVTAPLELRACSEEEPPTPEETAHHAEMTAARGSGPNGRVVININFNQPMLEPGTFNFFGRGQP